jgi:hypothetical protein
MGGPRVGVAGGQIRFAGRPGALCWGGFPTLLGPVVSVGQKGARERGKAKASSPYLAKDLTAVGLPWVGREPWLVGRLWGTVRGQAQESLDGGIQMYRTVHRYEGYFACNREEVPTCISCDLCPGLRAMAIGAPLRRRSEAK